MKHSDRTDSLALVLILVGIAGRLLPHPPNMTPIGGMALWGGNRLTGIWRYVVVLLPMLVSDLFLGSHSTLPYVYGSLLLITWLAGFLKKTSIMTLAGAALIASTIFFVVTNLGVWLTSPLYPHTFAGLLACYTAALPFFQYTLIGDLAYTALFFGLEYGVTTYAQRHSQQTATK